MVGASPPEVEVILPCLNEAEALGWVLGHMPPGIRPIVVDNGSTDGSVAIAHDHGAQVVHAPQRGYGAACHAGLLAATAPIVAVMDADASLNPQQLDRVVAPIIGGTADLVIGTRSPVSAAAFPWLLRLANRELSRRVLRRTGLRRCRPRPDAGGSPRVAAGLGGPRTAGLATQPRPWYAPPTPDGESSR